MGVPLILYVLMTLEEAQLELKKKAEEKFVWTLIIICSCDRFSNWLMAYVAKVELYAWQVELVDYTTLVGSCNLQ